MEKNKIMKSIYKDIFEWALENPNDYTLALKKGWDGNKIREVFGWDYPKLEKLLVKKYKDKIFTKDGKYNLITLKQIARKAGIKNPDAHHGLGVTYICCVDIEPYSHRNEEEVLNVYRHCEWIKLQIT